MDIRTLLKVILITYERPWRKTLKPDNDGLMVDGRIHCRRLLSCAHPLSSIKPKPHISSLKRDFVVTDILFFLFHFPVLLHWVSLFSLLFTHIYIIYSCTFTIHTYIHIHMCVPACVWVAPSKRGNKRRRYF